MPIFSVIIPVHNVEKYIKRTIDSLLIQTERSWEAICVDDGSTDGSYNIITECAKEDNRIVVVHQDNHGVVAARHKGFQQSRGRYVLFLDGDDSLEAFALERIRCEILKTEADIIQFGYTYYMDFRPIKNVAPNLNGVYSFEAVMSVIKQTPLEVLDLCIWNKCYVRRVAEIAFKDVSDIHIKHSEDGLYALSAFWKMEKICFIADLLYRYNIRIGSATQSIGFQIVADKEIFTLKTYNQAVSSNRVSDEWARRIYRAHAKSSISFIFALSLSKQRTLRDSVKLLRLLSLANFYISESSDRSTCSRAVMRMVINHPYLLVVLRPLLRAVLLFRTKNNILLGIN